MNNETAFTRSPLPSPEGDVLEQLTITFRDMQDRSGPLLGFAAPLPVEARQFEAAQARKGLEIDVAQTPAEKAIALLDSEASRNEQIGRLADWIAGYELAYGDERYVEPLRQIRDDYRGMAVGLRGEIERERSNELEQTASMNSANNNSRAEQPDRDSDLSEADGVRDAGIPATKKSGQEFSPIYYGDALARAGENKAAVEDAAWLKAAESAQIDQQTGGGLMVDFVTDEIQAARANAQSRIRTGRDL
jgi:hypothetical protein